MTEFDFFGTDLKARDFDGDGVDDLRVRGNEGGQVIRGSAQGLVAP